MELRAARAAARRRVGAYTATVTAVGFAWLVLALPAAVRAAGRDPGPVLVLAALVLAAELMPLELGRPGTRDSTTMSQSLISTDSILSLRVKIVHQGTTTSIRLALRNGRSVGARPSMTTFST